MEKLNRESVTELGRQKFNVISCQGGDILVDYPGLEKEPKYTLGNSIEQSSKTTKTDSQTTLY